MSLADLSKLLDRRNTLDEPASMDQQIWQACGATRAILVLDMSGFTRLTRKHGILHFLAVFRRAFQLVTPIVAAHAGRLVKAEADNVIASFPSARAAFDAANEMLQAAALANASLDEDNRLRLCIAIGYGHILELSDDFFGDEVNVTFKLGEDVAKAGELLLTEGAMASLKEDGVVPPTNACQVEAGGVVLTYHQLAM